MRLPNIAATEALGARIAPMLREGDIVALDGGLGVGKTTLTRGLLRALGHDGEVPSPSFAIIQPYEPPAVRLPVAHVDLYRLNSAEELAELGLDEWMADGVLIVEWPDRLGPVLLEQALRLRLEPDGPDARTLTASLPPAWENRWPPQ